ncbi:hypothetical protein HPTD01_1443 [Halomonas sp. TD01]|nr:hypothetical protein HPTD01_1443 [Halomonas sp. TD01]
MLLGLGCRLKENEVFPENKIKRSSYRLARRRPCLLEVTSIFKALMYLERRIVDIY